MTGTTNATAQAHKIAEIIAQYQKLQYKYLEDENSRQCALQVVESSIERYLQKFPGQTLQFVLPGFPFKSPIRTIFGYKLQQKNTIDAADFFAITQLETFIKQLRNVYEPGARIDILMDSEGFKELEKVPDAAIAQYKRELEYVIKRLNLDTQVRFIRYADLHLEEDFAHYQQLATPTFNSTKEGDFLKRYIGLYEYHRKQLQQLFKIDDELLSEDLLSRKREAKNRLNAKAKEAAYSYIWLQDAWREIVAIYFPHHLRLTIHPQPANSEKIGIYLTDKSNVFAPVPWQGVPLRIITEKQTYTDTVVNYSELLRLNQSMRFQYVYFDRIDLELPCYIIEGSQLRTLSEVFARQAMARQVAHSG